MREVGAHEDCTADGPFAKLSGSEPVVVRFHVCPKICEPPIRIGKLEENSMVGWGADDTEEGGWCVVYAL